MKSYILSLAIVLSASAANAAGIPKNLTYETTSVAKADSQSLLSKTSSQFESMDLWEFPLFSDRTQPLFSVDQIYASRDLKKAVFLKFGIIPSNPKVLGSVITDGDDGALFHGAYGKIPYAIYFMGFSNKDIQKTVDQLITRIALNTNNGTKQTQGGFFAWLIQDAHAETKAGEEHLTPCIKKDSSFNAISIITNPLATYHFVGKCIKEGTWGTIKALYDTGKLVGKEIFSRHQWAQNRETLKGISKLIPEIESTLKELWNTYDSFDIQTKAQIICQLLIQAPVSILAAYGIGVATGGLGAPVAVGQAAMGLAGYIQLIAATQKLAGNIIEGSERCRELNETVRAKSVQEIKSLEQNRMGSPKTVQAK